MLATETVLPLKCLDARDQPVFSFDFSRETFEALRQAHRRTPTLHFECCDSRVGLRISSTGLPHFYHLNRETGCHYATETDAHLKLKHQVMLAARAAGWQAECEVQSPMGADSLWRADVLMSSGNARVAVEVQLAKLPWEEICRRQEQYRRAGIRGLWLLTQGNYDVCRETPAFQLRGDPNGSWEVRISPPRDIHNTTLLKHDGFWIGLDEFVHAALKRNLVWAPVAECRRVNVVLRVVPHPACSCGQSLLVPTSLAVSLPYPRHRALLWTVLPGQPFAPNPGPAWLNTIVAMLNETHRPRQDCLIATRLTEGRALHRNACPSCGALHDDLSTRHSEVLVALNDVPLEHLPAPQPESAEWQFVNQWWVRSTCATSEHRVDGVNA